MQVTFGLRRPDEHVQQARLTGQAFRVDPGEHDPTVPQLADDRVHVARDGDRIVATASVWPFGQWFGGRCVPMGGVAAVAVLPEARGKGLARRILTEAIVAMRERGEVLSALYPTTARLYRSMGYEHAARHLRVGVSMETLGRVVPPEGGDRVRRVEVDEMRSLSLVYDAVAAHHDGWLRRGDTWWDRVAHRYSSGGNRFAYVVERGDQAVGSLFVHHSDPEGSRPGFHLYDLSVDGPFAVDHQALRAGLAFLAGHGNITGEIRTTLPVELLSVLVADQHLRVIDQLLCMLRLVDLAGAMSARGYLGERVGPVDVGITDDVAEWNDGPHRLVVEDGQGRAEPGGDGHVQMDVSTLAALWSGWASPWQLALAGRLPGATAADLTVLAHMFASRSTPHVLDFF